jgi:hypothetical protein
MGVSGDAGGRHHPDNDETPGRIIVGREFRETETGSSGNYPRVGSSRKSLICDDAATDPTAGTGELASQAQRRRKR